MKIERFKVDLNRLKGELAEDVFGITKEDAIEQAICINCRQSITTPGLFYSMVGRREWAISGTCERCFDKMWSEDDSPT